MYQIRKRVSPESALSARKATETPQKMPSQKRNRDLVDVQGPGATSKGRAPQQTTRRQPASRSPGATHRKQASPTIRMSNYAAAREEQQLRQLQQAAYQQSTGTTPRDGGTLGAQDLAAGSPSAHHVYPRKSKQFTVKQQNLTFQLTQQIEKQTLNHLSLQASTNAADFTQTPGAGGWEERNQCGDLRMGEAEKLQRIVEKKMKASAAAGRRPHAAASVEQGPTFGLAETDELKPGNHAPALARGLVESLESFGPDAIKMSICEMPTAVKDQGSRSNKKTPQGAKDSAKIGGSAARRPGHGSVTERGMLVPEASRHASSVSGESVGHTPLGTGDGHAKIRSDVNRGEGQPHVRHISLSNERVPNSNTNNRRGDHIVTLQSSVNPLHTPAPHVIEELDSTANSVGSHMRQDVDADAAIAASMGTSARDAVTQGDQGHGGRSKYKKGKDTRKPKQRDVLQLKTAVFLSDQMDNQLNQLDRGYDTRSHITNATAQHPPQRPQVEMIEVRGAYMMNQLIDLNEARKINMASTPEPASIDQPLLPAQVSVSTNPAQLASQATSTSKMAFNANRNKTVSSKNKNYQPQKITQRVREQLFVSASGGSLFGSRAGSSGLAMTKPPETSQILRKRDDAIAKVLAQYNIKLGKQSANFSNVQEADLMQRTPPFRRVTKPVMPHTRTSHVQVLEQRPHVHIAHELDQHALHTFNAPSFSLGPALVEGKSSFLNSSPMKNRKFNQTAALADLARHDHGTPSGHALRSAQNSTQADLEGPDESMRDQTEERSARLSTLQADGMRRQIQEGSSREGQPQGLQLDPHLLSVSERRGKEPRAEDMAVAAKGRGGRNNQADAGGIVDRRQPESGQGGTAMPTITMPRADHGMMKFKVPVALEVETGDAEQEQDQTDDTKDVERTEDENKHATQELSQQAKEVEVSAADDAETVHQQLRAGSDGANAPERRATSMTTHQDDLAPGPRGAPKHATGRAVNDADANKEDSEHPHHARGPLRDISMANIERNYDEMVEPDGQEHQQQKQQDVSSGGKEDDSRADNQVRSDLGTVKVVRGQRFATIDAIVRNQELQDASRSQAQVRSKERQQEPPSSINTLNNSLHGHLPLPLKKVPSSVKRGALVAHDSYNIVTPRIQVKNRGHLAYDTVDAAAAGRRQVVKVQSERKSEAFGISAPYGVPAQGGLSSPNDHQVSKQVSSETFRLAPGHGGPPDHAQQQWEVPPAGPSFSKARSGGLLSQQQFVKKVQIQFQPAADLAKNARTLGLAPAMLQDAVRVASLSPQRTPLFPPPSLQDPHLHPNQNPALRSNLCITSATGQQKMSPAASLTQSYSPSSSHAAGSGQKYAAESPQGSGAAGGVSSLLHGVRGSPAGLLGSGDKKSGPLMQSTFEKGDERGSQQLRDPAHQAIGNELPPGTEFASWQAEMAPEHAEHYLGVPMDQQQLIQRQQMGVSPQAQANQANIKAMGRDYNVFCAIPQVNMMTKDELPGVPPGAGKAIVTHGKMQAGAGVLPAEKQQRAFNLMRALKFSKLSKENRIRLQQQNLGLLQDQVTGSQDSISGKRLPTEYSGLTRSPMSLNVSPSTEAGYSQAQLFKATRVGQDVTGAMLAQAKESSHAHGGPYHSTSGDKTIAGSDSGSNTQIGYAVSPRQGHQPGATPGHAVMVDVDARSHHQIQAAQQQASAEAAAPVEGRAPKGSTEQAAERNQDLATSVTQVAAGSPGLQISNGQDQVDQDQQQVKLAVLQKRVDGRTLDKGSENDPDSVPERSGAYFEEGPSGELSPQDWRRRGMTLEQQAQGLSPTYTVSRTSVVEDRNAQDSLLQATQPEDLAEMAVLRASLTKETKHTFSRGNHHERELHREKYLRLLPQNLSDEVEASKAFGGRNALLHVRKKLERDQRKDKKVKVNQSNRSTLQPPMQASQIVDVSRRGLMFPTSEDTRQEETAEDDGMPAGWSTKEIKEMRMRQNVPDSHTSGKHLKGQPGNEAAKRKQSEAPLGKADPNKRESQHPQHCTQQMSKDLHGLKSVERIQLEEAKEDGRAAGHTKFCRKTNQGTKPFISPRARLEEDHSEMALSLFPPLKQRQISPRYNQLKAGKKSDAGRRKSRYEGDRMLVKAGRGGDQLEGTQDSKTLTMTYYEQQFCNPQYDFVRQEREAPTTLPAGQFAAMSAIAKHHKITLTSRERELSYSDAAHAARSQTDGRSPAVTSQLLQTQSRGQKYPDQQHGPAAGASAGAYGPAAGGSSGRPTPANASALPLKSLVAREADPEAKSSALKDKDKREGAQTSSDGPLKRNAEPQQSQPTKAERQALADDIFMQELAPVGEPAEADPREASPDEGKQGDHQSSKGKRHHIELARLRRDQISSQNAQQLNLTTVSIDYDNLMVEDAENAATLAHDQSHTESQHQNIHTIIQSASLGQKKRLSRDEKLKGSLREYVGRPTNPRDGVHDFVGSLQLEGQKPQLIHPAVAEDPHLKYVRRIKNNDFLGKRSGRNQDMIISQYSQDYERLCLLHQGPKLAVDNAAKYAQALSQHRDQADRIDRQKHNNTVLPGSLGPKHEKEAGKLELSLSVLSPLGRKERPSFAGPYAGHQLIDDHQHSKSGAFRTSTNAGAKKFGFGERSSRLMPLGALGKGVRADDPGGAAGATRMNEKTMTTQEKSLSFGQHSRQRLFSKLYASSGPLGGPDARRVAHRSLDRHLSDQVAQHDGAAALLQARLLNNNTVDGRRAPRGQALAAGQDGSQGRGGQDPQYRQPFGAYDTARAKPRGGYGGYPLFGVQGSPFTPGDQYHRTTSSKGEGVNLPSVLSKDTTPSQAHQSGLGRLTGGASTICSPRWPPPGSVPGSHPQTGKGTPLDPLDAILDKEGAEDKLLERQMNPTLYVTVDSNQPGPGGEQPTKQRRRPAADAAAAQQQLGQDYEAMKGASQCSQERVQKIQARGASMIKLKHQMLNQDSHTRLSAEEGTRELEAGPAVAPTNDLPGIVERNDERQNSGQPSHSPAQSTRASKLP